MTVKQKNELVSDESHARRLEEIGQQLVMLLQPSDVAQKVHISHDENEWSVMQTLGHLVEMIPFWINQCTLLIEDKEELLQFGRELDAPQRVDGINRGTELELDEIINILKQEIHRASQVIRSMSNEERAKKGNHIRFGQMTVSEIIERLIVTHAEEHLDQVRSTLQLK
jgi:uncharacterized damage-inducible protein DinB